MASCVVCSAPATSSCSKCHVERYCSKECQVGAWAAHKHTCSEFVEVRQSALGGQGLFARKDLAVGDEIIREKPLVYFQGGRKVCRNQAEADELTARQKLENLRKVEELPKDKLDAAMALHDCRATDGDKTAGAASHLV
jgi:hypothetical protein